jgi:hypothetical protein
MSLIDTVKDSNNESPVQGALQTAKGIDISARNLDLVRYWSALHLLDRPSAGSSVRCRQIWECPQQYSEKYSIITCDGLIGSQTSRVAFDDGVLDMT